MNPFMTGLVAGAILWIPVGIAITLTVQWVGYQLDRRARARDLADLRTRYLRDDTESASVRITDLGSIAPGIEELDR